MYTLNIFFYRYDNKMWFTLDRGKEFYLYSFLVMYGVAATLYKYDCLCNLKSLFFTYQT